MIFSTSCVVSNVSSSQQGDNNSKTTSLNLLDRLRSLPGLRISGVGRNAQVYLRGITSINNYREVIFYVNGNRVGNFSSAFQVVLPENITSIKLLKSASELLDKTTEKKESEKLLKIINHDAERIERLITDYSQMLKDEASLSREKMIKVNLMQIILNVVEDFRQDLINQNKKIEIITSFSDKNEKNFFIIGIENRLEQVIANLLDNAISFSRDQQKIEIDLTETSNNFVMTIKDQGPGFTEASPQKIFKRFYSNRPSNFGEHSGLGLNIAKNIVELHKGAIAASNRINQKGAQVKVLLPKILS